MKVAIKVVEKGYMPTKATSGAAAFDCYARTVKYSEDDGYLQIKLGFALEIPEGYVGKLYPRSSVTNRGMSLGNSVGIIDSDFRGEVQARFYPNPSSILAKNPNMTHSKLIEYCNSVYQVGEACAQLIIEKLEDIDLIQVEELNETARGDGGFGSTNRS